jgi:multimeric flavodoxin WrbA
MKIVTLLGSPRPHANSSAIAKHLSETAARLGAETETFELNRLEYKGCQGCYACKTSVNFCVVKDGLTQVLEGVREADAVVLASPVYYGDVTAQLKGYLDRNFAYLKPDYRTNPQPSRLAPKKLVFVLTQGNPDEKAFTDIYPRYQTFLKWMGFTETQLIRICGVGPESSVPESALRLAEEAARALLA